MAGQGLTWDLVADLQLLLQFHFMQNAFIVGTLVAALAGAVGYYVVLRGQSFASHMLSQVGFPGAGAAVLFHVAPVIGLMVFCSTAAVGVAVLGGRLDAGRRRESAAVGTVLAFALGLGLLFFRLVHGSAQAIYAFLFGTILGISDRDVALTLAAGGVALAVLLVIGRPLTFTSIDPVVAEARGVPVRLLAAVFLLLVGAAVAVAVQVVGTLLIFALLVAPGAAAQRATSRPARGLALSVALSLLAAWLGLAAAYFSGYPVGFFITSFAFAAYLGVRAFTGARALLATRAPAAVALGAR